MATSQFKIYQSTDLGAPVLNGLTGSFLNVLNGCLYSGYAGRASAGWLKPLPDTGSYGMFTLPSGSGLSVFIDDSGTLTGVGAEANVCGWESITTINNGKVTGSNPFPTAAQQTFNGVGAVTFRKATAATSAVRNWIMFADAYTYYFYHQADNYGYFVSSFGDIYSYYTGSDDYRTMIIGRNIQNDATLTNDPSDKISIINAACTGHFIARTYTGAGTSITIGKHADSCRNAGTITLMRGDNQYPNGPDCGLYMTPLYVTETSGIIRGVLRGQYNISHPPTNFSDGQQFSGSGDYAGKTFRLVKFTPNLLSCFCIETSNTLDTNI